MSSRLRSIVRNMSLGAKAILFNFALTSIVISAVFVSLSIEIRSETKQLLQDILNRSERQVLSIKEDNFAQLLWVSSQISNNPTLRAAMETYRLESPLRTGSREELLATLQNELDKIWVGLSHDLLFVTDEMGAVLAANGRLNIEPETGENLASLPVLKHALDPAAAMGEQNFGVINLKDQYYLIGALPIEMQGFVLGSLTLGDRIDSSFLPNLRAFFGGDTVVTVGRRSISSTLVPSDSDDSGADVLATAGTAAIKPDGTARLAGEDYLITAMPLGISDAGEPVTLFLLRSLTQALQQPNAKLKKTLALQAALAILLGALLTWVAVRTSLRPLGRFVAFMQGVAETGDYSRRFFGRRAGGGGHAERPDHSQSLTVPDSGSRNELDLLVNGFNDMLAVIETRDRSLKSAHAGLEDSIQALKQKEEELRQSQKMEAIGLLAGGVAHDFNNILMVISGFSELALLTLEQNHEARANIEEVRKACKSATLLTRQLLAISSKHVFNPKVIDLNALIRDFEKILRRVIGEAIDLRTRLATELHPILADPAQIEQVLLNLTLNARDAIESAGQICIATDNADGDDDQALHADHFMRLPHVVLSVSDSGSGMDKPTQSRMFEPFFTTKEKGKGSGLGLSTVHGIIKQSGGHIRVESQPGHGTVFKLYFPRVAQTIERGAEISKRDAMRGSETILVVEDEPEVRKIVCKVLSLSGYTVLDASGPLEALTRFGQHGQSVDLLLTDVIMPVMNGRELFEKIALQHPKLKVLFMSGYTDSVIDPGGILPDGVNFLQKPFAPDALATKIRAVLDNHP